MKPRFIVYEDAAGLFRWRLLAANNRVIADSGEGYSRERDARRAAANVCTACRRIYTGGKG